MNLIFSFLGMLLITKLTAKKHGNVRKDHDREDSLMNGNKHMDMSGTLRKEFFVNGALYKPEESTICSPISALMPLGKLALGADGKSLDELLAAIGITRKSMIGSHFKPLIVELRNLPGIKLDIANKIYVSVNSRLQKVFAEHAREIFDSSVEKIDFQYPTYASEQINSWVSSQTNGMIKDLLDPTDITLSTSAILINAVYFNGKWKQKFNKTKSGKFHTPKGEKTIPMMTTTESYNYTKSEALGAQLINIPYAGDKASFLLILPTSRTGISVILSQLKLAPEILDSAMSRMEKTEIKLTMPTFKIESEFDLNLMYKKIGVKQIFHKNNSGLSKIIHDETFHISEGKQKILVDVNEFGTEAAAASEMFMTKLGFHRPLEIKADRPFLFFILARGQQLFSGTLVNPK